MCLALRCLPHYVYAKIKLRSKASWHTRLYTQSVRQPDRDRKSPVVLGGESAEVMLQGSQGGHSLPAGLTHPPHLHTHTQTLMTKASRTKPSLQLPDCAPIYINACTHALSQAHRFWCPESLVSPLQPMHARGFYVRVAKSAETKT